MKLAVDMSSYIKTALLAGIDAKDGETVEFDGKKVVINSAEYGYENFTKMMLNTMESVGVTPMNVLLVFEGLSSKSKRLLIDSLYKSKRDKKPPEFYVQFQRLREFIESQWLGLGAISLCQDYAEADDTLAYLAMNLEEELVIATRDSDLGVLNMDANPKGVKVSVWNDGLWGIPKLDGEPFIHPTKYITLYKALVGDDSDTIPGCKGFGKAKFQTLAETYGYEGLDEIMVALDTGSLGEYHGTAEMLNDKKKPAHPLIKMLVEQEESVIKAWKLVKMYPEWINTVRHPLKIQGGKVSSVPEDKDERLEHFYSREWLVDAENFDDSLVFLKEQLAFTAEPTFDIETSTPDESDEWLAGRPKGKGMDKVDQFGSILTGFSITFGNNNQFTMYVSVDHADTANVKMSQARIMMEAMIATGKPIIIHNNFFELCVLATQKDEDGTPWIELWKDLGARGFMPNTLDTKIEASYVNENISNGLKFRSEHHLGYKQTSYDATTKLQGFEHLLPDGGRLLSVVDTEDKPDDNGEVAREVIKQYKMRELTGEHVTAYGCDDTICTGALHNLFKLVMMLEGTYQVYKDVEIDASYQHAKNFIDGIPFSLEKMRELEQHHDEVYDEAWAILRAYLIEKGWEGTVPPVYGTDITPAQIKEAYKIVVKGDSGGGLEIGSLDEGGDEDEPAYLDSVPAEELADAFLASRVRTVSKLIALARAEGHEVFATKLAACVDNAEGATDFTRWVQSHFTGDPAFKIGPHQIAKLLYDTMGLPVHVRGKPTDIMKAKGIFEGNRKGNALALEYAIKKDATPEQKKVIEAIKLLVMVKTQRSLYYVNYPHFIHWKDGRLHSSHNQCQANTRRASATDPNTQQLTKHEKIDGQKPRFRETLVPHHKNAVVVSLDFDSQELRVIADYSRDANMVACYVGDNKKDMHALTGHKIALSQKTIPKTMEYAEFAVAAKDEKHELNAVCKVARALGKKVNFTTEFGAMAPKLAQTMLVTEEEAQVFIDAKEAMFPGVRVWKDEVIAESKRLGYVTTKMGARRHLRDAYADEAPWIRSKAERQAVNFKVQSSSAEMTKRAEGRMWQMGLVDKYDCICFGPIHDEVVFSVAIADLEAFLVDAHWCMTQPYGDMEIPIESSISFGPNFGLQIEIGIKPTKEAVQAGLKAMYAAIEKAKKSSAAVAA